MNRAGFTGDCNRPSIQRPPLRFHGATALTPQLLEHLQHTIRYCARPPFALDRLHIVDHRSDQILYLLPKPDLAGRTALRLSTLELLDLLAKILPPPLHPARGPPQTELRIAHAGG